MLKKYWLQTSLVAQWFRISLPVQGTRVQSLVREDATRCRATKCGQQSLRAATREWPLLATTRENLHAATKTQHRQTQILNFFLKKDVVWYGYFCWSSSCGCQSSLQHTNQIAKRLCKSFGGLPIGPFSPLLPSRATLPTPPPTPVIQNYNLTLCCLTSPSSTGRGLQFTDLRSLNTQDSPGAQLMSQVKPVGTRLSTLLRSLGLDSWAPQTLS